MNKTVALLCCLLLLAVSAQAKDKHRDDDKRERQGDKSWSKQRDQDRYEDRDDDRRSKSRDDLPPGLRKKQARGKDLPPGWQKKLGKGKRLDDSIYIHLVVPPRELIAVLPPPPPGVSFKRLEDKIIKIDDINRRILDVLEIDKLPVPTPSRLPKPPLPPLPRLP